MRLVRLPGRQQRDTLSSIPAIRNKVMIQRKYARIAPNFAHSHQAGIGKTHGCISILAKQAQGRLPLILKIESNLQEASIN